MSREEFRIYLLDSQPIFKAWGNRIVSEITSEIHRKLGERYSSFLKIAPEPRVKEIGSAIGKIVRKGYNNPAQEMTDLVGARFVVLFRTDIDIICQVIEGSSLWTSSLDRDYDAEIEDDPSYFDYQSKHYILRANGDIHYEGVVIPNKTACEVQIRTLLQHAYAEIVHDNIYKPSGVVPQKSKRLVARSMALMETTDDLFCDTIKELENANKQRNTVYAILAMAHKSILKDINHEIDIDFNYAVIDTYNDITKERTLESLVEFIDSRKYISERIIARSTKLFLFRQPAVILLYLLISRSEHEVRARWPFGSLQDELNMIFSDLGIAHDGFVY